MAMSPCTKNVTCTQKKSDFTSKKWNMWVKMRSCGNRILLWGFLVNNISQNFTKISWHVPRCVGEVVTPTVEFRRTRGHHVFRDWLWRFHMKLIKETRSKMHLCSPPHIFVFLSVHPTAGKCDWIFPERRYHILACLPWRAQVTFLWVLFCGPYIFLMHMLPACHSIPCDMHP